MSLPSFPNVDPPIQREDAVNQILSSIAMEELGLSHILNAEGEKMQYILGTLPGLSGPAATVEDVLNANESVRGLLETAVQNQIFLKGKMQGALDAIGLDGRRLDIVLMQLVNLMKDGKPVKVSKRTGNAVTLVDLLDEVPIDSARFFFNVREPGSTIDFDLGLAVSEDSQNPVYYCQYANARICSILKKLQADGVTPRTCTTAELERLTAPEEHELIRHLAALTDEIILAANNYDPAKITRYATNLATLFHKYYNACKIAVEDEALMQARLNLCLAVRSVMVNLLTAFKISAPESM